MNKTMNTLDKYTMRVFGMDGIKNSYDVCLINVVNMNELDKHKNNY